MEGIFVKLLNMSISASVSAAVKGTNNHSSVWKNVGILSSVWLVGAIVLLSFSDPTHRIAACPLAFGEVGVKQRIQSVLNYRKSAFWMVGLAIVILVVTSVCIRI